MILTVGYQLAAQQAQRRGATRAQGQRSPRTRTGRTFSDKLRWIYRRLALSLPQLRVQSSLAANSAGNGGRGAGSIDRRRPGPDGRTRTCRGRRRDSGRSGERVSAASAGDGGSVSAATIRGRAGSSLPECARGISGRYVSGQGVGAAICGPLPCGRADFPDGCRGFERARADVPRLHRQRRSLCRDRRAFHPTGGGLGGGIRGPRGTATLPGDDGRRATPEAS